jgi:hypothetical protein
MITKERIKNDLKEALMKYEGKDFSENYSAIREDIQSVFDRSIESRELFVNDFPIEFENYLGKFIIKSDGNCLYLPKIRTQRIETTITISPSSN